MPKFKVSFHETVYSEIEIEAESEEIAYDLVWEGGDHMKAQQLLDSDGVQIDDVTEIPETEPGAAYKDIPSDKLDDFNDAVAGN